MAISVFAADDYIELNVIDIEDWQDADDDKKQRILNVANRTINIRFKNLTIPDEAVYEFAAFLAGIFNDTNRMHRYGIKQFSIEGMSFTFSSGTIASLAELIPESVVDIINSVNDVVVSFRRVGRSVR